MRRMKLPPKLMKWIASNNSYILTGLITFTCPTFFLRSIYSNNIGNSNKKACLTLSFDCDYPEDVESIPYLLKVLDKYPFKTTFACVGYWIEKYPKEHAMILEHGHEIMNHTYSHPDNELLNPGRKFRYISRQEKMEEIERCHEICRKILNYEPKGLRIPHFKHLFTQEIYGILKDLNYQYSSSTWLTNTKTHGLPFFTEEGIVEFPLSTCPLHPFSVFDTWHSFNTPRWTHRFIHRGPDSYCDLFDELLTIGRETKSYLNIYIDPLDVKKISRFETILDNLVANDDFWIATYEELFEYLQARCSPVEG